jgi:hypothetical protein
MKGEHGIDDLSKEGCDMEKLKKEFCPVDYNKRSIICIFTDQGKTFTFEDCYITCSNESFLSFDYKAMKDSKRKVAFFPKANICGWSETY